MKLFRNIASAFLICLLLAAGNIFAQDGDGNPVIAAKVGYLTEELGLSSEETEIFIPVYIEYMRKKVAIRKKFKAKPDSYEGKIEKQEEILELTKEYNTKFKQLLASEKFLKLHKAEESWKLIIIDEMKRRKAKNK